MSQFIYLLNALEAASQHDTPAEVGYGAKRKALLEYVEKLESARPEALRIDACLHACEGLATADLAGNEYGWVTDVVTKAAAVEVDLEHYRRIVRRQDHGEAYDTQRRINIDLSAQLAEAYAAAGIAINGGGLKLPVWIKAIREQFAGTIPSPLARSQEKT